MGRLATGMLAIALAAVVAACGGSSASTVTHDVTATVTQTVTQTVTTTTPASTVTTTTTPASTVTTTSTPQQVGGVPACTAARLTPVFLGSNGATGHVVLSFGLRNRSGAPCHTYGWPGVQFLGTGGVKVATSAERTTSDLLGASPASPLTVSAGQQASFRIVVADMGSGGGSQGCGTATALAIIAPDDTATMVVKLSAPVTECGQATLSPLLAGGDAVPGV
jgi:hypothetical protein